MHSRERSTTSAARIELALYLDPSAVVKLISEEPESGAMVRFLRSGDCATSELALAEVPRALRRLAAERSRGELEALLTEMSRVLRGFALIPLDRELAVLAGNFDEPHLRALDAIHLATAVSVVEDLDAFVTYDARQAQAVRAAGLPLAQPGI